MVAIAAVVASKPGSSFMYFTKPVPRWLRKNPVGNFARTLALGAEVQCGGRGGGRAAGVPDCVVVGTDKAR